MQKGIYNKKDLAKYITLLYEKKYNKKISSIKFQKSIYFLFAYWGGFNKKLNQEIKNENEEGEIIKKDNIYLFSNPKFQARQFGPVEKEIFEEYKEYMKVSKNKLNENIKDEFSLYSKKMNENNESKNFIDDFLLNNIFDISDFSLVNWSHKDNSWIEAWNLEDKNSKEILSENIIEEYFKREEY
ncbi:MAG: hypothetical protein HPAVJP_5530 [Candidatus Hepatoplasma vulgare]|nr:MAG: hypothetical protein HPAVJP_5530 [Candidatus Hepatoplasma sp.]